MPTGRELMRAPPSWPCVQSQRHRWESMASIGICLPLVVVAVVLAQRSKAPLMDRSVQPDTLQRIHAAIKLPDWVAVFDLAAFFVGLSSC